MHAMSQEKQEMYTSIISPAPQLSSNCKCMAWRSTNHDLTYTEYYIITLYALPLEILSYSANGNQCKGVWKALKRSNLLIIIIHSLARITQF